MLFQNYGLFWQLERVKWGASGYGNAGTLEGIRTLSDGPVDFRDQRGVYAIYDDSFSMLYVGQAGYGNSRLYQRLHQHRSDALVDRWTKFSWFGIDPVRGRSGSKAIEQKEPSGAEVKDILNHLEAILIAAAEPRLNRQGGKFGKALQYRQWYHEPDDELDLRLSAIEKTLQALEKGQRARL